MTEEDALKQLDAIFAGAPYGTQADQHFAQALAAATIVDLDGRAPTDPAWRPTYDVWIAAANVADALHVRAMVSGAAGQGAGLESFTSEGATFKFTAGAAGSWADVAAWFRSKSPTLGNVTGIGWIDVGSNAPDQTFRSEWEPLAWRY